MFRTKQPLLLAIGSILAFGCNIESSDEVSVSSSALITEAGLVAFLGDYNVSTLSVLDFDCAIRSDSARNIDYYRRGFDLVYGTADDRTIDSEAELDSIFMVGPWTIAQLYSCAESYGYGDDPGTCDPSDQWAEEGDPPDDSEPDMEDVCNTDLMGGPYLVQSIVIYSDCGVEGYEVVWAATIEEEVLMYLTVSYDGEGNYVGHECDV
jgi:hypothetical protein